MGSIKQGTSIPIIDLSFSLAPDPSPESRKEVIAEVRSACQEYGFFQLTGHGIPLSLQREVLMCAKRLFNLPLDQKEAMAMGKSMGLSKRGYEAVGRQKLGDKPDTKEGFYIGVELPVDDPKAGTFLKGPNFWPAALSDEEFRKPVMEYHKRVLGLHEALLRILAGGLPYGKDVFDEFMEDPVANIKLLHYPPNPTKDAEELSLGGKSPDLISRFKAKGLLKLVLTPTSAAPPSFSSNLINTVFKFSTLQATHGFLSPQKKIS
jgi:isopenicillin N synthase-like dioxygenase